MKKILVFLVLLICFFFCGWLNAEKLGALENLLMPHMMGMGHDRVYCLEKSTVYMYELKGLKFLKKFCKLGEGPGELKINPGLSNFIVPLQDELMVVGFDKAIIYSKEGILKKEFRIPSLSANYLYPLGENRFLGLNFDTNAPGNKPQLIAGIVDNNMKIIKELYEQDFSGGQNLVNLTLDGINMAVAKDKIYIDQSAEGFVVSIYNLEGRLIKKIKKEMPPVKFSKVHEEYAINLLKQNPGLRSVGWENFKKMVTFTHDKYLPLIKDMQVDQKRIYLMSTNFKEDQQEFVVMDQEGNFLKKVFLPQPIPTDYVSVIFGRPTRYYKIYQGKYYYLRENLDEETWELHVEDL